MPRSQPASPHDYEIGARNRVVRRPARGFYDKKSVFEILDSGIMCHIAYVIDGQPYCTPTSYWREGDRVYWHGSSASRMLRNQVKGIPVCLTVTHLDALNLARRGFNHAVNYRSAMVYGRAELVGDDAKVTLMNSFIDRFYPGRSSRLQPPTVSDIKATSIVSMEIEQASAKIRAVDFGDDEEDMAVPAWTAMFSVKTILTEIVECPRQLQGVTKPQEMAGFEPGRALDEIVRESYAATFDSRLAEPAPGE